MFEIQIIVLPAKLYSGITTKYFSDNVIPLKSRRLRWHDGHVVLALGVGHFPSDALNRALEQINEKDSARALEVTGFYNDLQSSIRNVADLIKPGGYACYVVGNRKVKGVVLPTDLIVRDFFERCGFEYTATYHRSIPNKRMPLRNSPTNATGVSDQTMTQEYIVVMRRLPSRIAKEQRPVMAVRNAHARKNTPKRKLAPSSKPARTRASSPARGKKA